MRGDFYWELAVITKSEMGKSANRSGSDAFEYLVGWPFAPVISVFSDLVDLDLSE